MSERAAVKKGSGFGWGSVILVVLLVALFVVSFVLGSGKASDGEEGFGGTDSAVVEIMDEQGAQPWFHPLFEPGSGEIESGLFALQAALGAGVVGFAFGNLRGRQAERNRVERERAEGGPDGDPAVEPEPAAS
ncbi:hypothetical protein GCM10009785_12790 [Brooklawnia cerclae]|uniref:Cobalt transport protein CbiN n=1 Tax=Brooklawnia cerclae TaxID=349934 RepID=A0ABX0SPZ5_9ACTN|nr:energy-coupling factor ABC transporter substrate-binding protein [Brooklawnia cerclae]NIH58806.1 cobalt/nickel transport protein [Brooklawnia cerclae]